MRKLNAILTLAIIALLLIHGIAGAFQLMGIIPGGSFWVQMLTWIMIVILAVHIVIGTILTIDTIRISAKAGVSYIRVNKLFWIRRISGFALMVLLILHLIVFVQTGNGIFRLHDFDIPQLVGQIIMLVALVIHLLCNIKPIAIALGLHSSKGYGNDILLILAVVMAFCAVGFVIYYLRWNIWWR